MDRVMTRSRRSRLSSRASRPTSSAPPGKRNGVYLLAGNVREDGSLPYWWMPRTRLTTLRSRFDRRRGGRILNVP